MQTIAINDRFGRSNLLKVLAVVGALSALYFYRRRGGTVSGLIGQGKDLAGRVREQATDAYKSITDSSSEVEDAVSDTKANIKDATQSAKSRLQSETSSVH